MYFIVDLVHGAADLLQSAAGIIADLILVNARPEYLGDDQCQRRNLREKYSKKILGEIMLHWFRLAALVLLCV